MVRILVTSVVLEQLAPGAATSMVVATITATPLNQVAAPVTPPVNQELHTTVTPPTVVTHRPMHIQADLRHTTEVVVGSKAKS